jgi:surfactin synthase thioesterase subunit
MSITTTHASKWFLVTRPKPRARYRLFCFPYAGGSATAYANWEELLPEDIELVAIQPPGRGNRFNERLITSVEEAVSQIRDAIRPWLDRPYLLYGHSLGSVVSFELLHSLKANGLPLPVRYCSGARRAPHTAPRIAPIHDYPLAQFKTELKKLNGTPDIVLNNPELMDIFVPILRTDFKAAYAYHRAPDIKLDCAASIFGGAKDDIVPQEDLTGWQEHFRKPIDLRVFAGGHFFLEDDRELVVSAICKELVA